MDNIHKFIGIGALSLMLTMTGTLAANYYGKTTSYMRIGCEIYTNSIDCTGNGCYWWDGICHSWPVVGQTERCYILDEEITMCITKTGDKYLIIDVGNIYGEVIDIA